MSGNGELAAAAYAIDGHTPQRVEFPATVDELARCTAAAHATDLAVIPVGNGTQLGIGRAPTRYDIALSLRRMNRILAHEAADMTATVEAGVTLAELNAALASAGQRLPLDPPHPEPTTIGALIATDASGPLRLSQGKVRDLLIGITVVLADGTIVHGGGRVVKNVAGYDLMKLFTGSFGTLGIIVEATFKLRPLPEREAVFVIPAGDTRAAVKLALEVLAAPLVPLYVEALNPAGAACVGLDAPAVVIGCGGSGDEIAVQRERLAERCGEDTVQVCNAAEGGRLYAALRDFPACCGLLPNPPPLPEARPEPSRRMATGEGTDCGCKLSVLPSQLAGLLVHIEEEAARSGLEAAILSHVGSGIAALRINGGGALPAFAEGLRTAVRAAGGWAVFDAVPTLLKAQIDPWGVAPPAMALMRGIKQTLDPHGRLSPGRFVGGI